MRWSRLKNRDPGDDVRDRLRACLPVPAQHGRGRHRARHAHEGRALHHSDAGAARQGGRPPGRDPDGGSRHQGRPLRIHAVEDRDRRPERPVPHPAPHHRADGRDDGAGAEGRDLRSRLRHLRLPGRGRRISARQPSEAVSGKGDARPFPRGDVPRLRFRRHHAAHRLDEHDAARRRQSRHPLQGFAGAGACRRFRPLFASCSPIRPSPARSTTRPRRKTCSRSSRPRRPSFCSWRCS